MKAHSVKSNAKRFSRGLAKRFPYLEPCEPEEAAAGGWLPVVMPQGAIPSTDRAEIEPVAIIAEPVGGWDEPANDGVDATDRMGAARQALDNIDPATVTHEQIQEVETMARNLDKPEPKPQKPAKPEPGKDEPAKPRPTAHDHAMAKVAGFSPDTAMHGRLKGEARKKPKMTDEEFARAAASLPPRRDSTPEEIAGRRAERRARLEAERANPTPAKTTKRQTILDLTGREGGATVAELADATGWQRHTLRGYIAGTLRKAGFNIECVRGKDGTRYVMASKDD